ncbi:MAG: O-antigen ligase family protein [Candidatus Peribacteraceae bacterium]|nr:O-antigen ligase family protein [Candidatus Peribacteraceae bacterium]
MSKTGLLFLVIYIFGLASAFIRGPMLGLLTYIFTCYTLFSWGREIPHFYQYRFSLVAGIVLLLAFLTKKMMHENIAVLKMPQLKWLLLMLINMIFITPFAVNIEAHMPILIDFVKLVLLYYLIISIVQTKLYYKLFIYAQLWGNYFLGWQAYTHGEMHGGRLENIGMPGIKNSNSLANYLVIILPFIGNFTILGKKWEKLAAIIVAPFVLNAIILCNSRGAYLAIGVMAILYALRAKKGMRLKIITAIILAAVCFSYLSNENVWERLQTFNEVKTEGSAVSRLDTWDAALDMTFDYPLGTGGDGWKKLSPDYIPLIVDAHEGHERSVHNTYLEILTSWGIQGLILYILFLGSTFLELRKIRQRTGSDDDVFFHSQALALEVALVGYLIGAFFGARAYVEGLYWYCAIVMALSNIQQTEIVKQEEQLAIQQAQKPVSLEEIAVPEALAEKAE